MLHANHEDWLHEQSVSAEALAQHPNLHAEGAPLSSCWGSRWSGPGVLASTPNPRLCYLPCHALLRPAPPRPAPPARLQCSSLRQLSTCRRCSSATPTRRCAFD